MLEKAGRIHTFSARVSDPVVKLLVGSEVPLILQECRTFLKRIQRALRRNFRVAPGQPHAKRCLAPAREVRNAVINEFSRYRDPATRAGLPGALNPLLESKSAARILYERFRCEAIHGGHVRLDEQKFFTERQPYWKPLWSRFYGPFQLMEFPAQFLHSLLSQCIRNYRRRLEVLGKVPPDVHFSMFPNDAFERLDLLDETLLPRGRTAVPR